MGKFLQTYLKPSYNGYLAVLCRFFTLVSVHPPAGRFMFPRTRGLRFQRATDSKPGEAVLATEAAAVTVGLWQLL